MQIVVRVNKGDYPEPVLAERLSLPREDDTVAADADRNGITTVQVVPGARYRVPLCDEVYIRVRDSAFVRDPGFRDFLKDAYGSFCAM